MGEKLTKPQRRLLERIAAQSLSDGSGRGLFLEGHAESAVANRLARRGFVMLGVIHAKVTEAGRAALASQPNQEPERPESKP